MADYKHQGFDSYGYSEEIQFVPLQEQCKIEYTEPLVTEEPKKEDECMDLGFVEQNNLTIPKCKCLRH